MEKIKVIIADDSDFVRDGMKIILDVDDEFEVLGSASNGEEAIRLAKINRPDVFLMDIQIRMLMKNSRTFFHEDNRVGGTKPVVYCVRIIFITHLSAKDTNVVMKP